MSDKDRNREAIAWISIARAKRIERAYPELEGWIGEESQTGGRPCGGTFAGNMASDLRMRGEHRLAETLLIAAREIR